MTTIERVPILRVVLADVQKYSLTFSIILFDATEQLPRHQSPSCMRNLFTCVSMSLALCAISEVLLDTPLLHVLFAHDREQS
jgi:hypothetical protein